MACGDNGLRAMFVQSEKCNELMRRWQAANLALWGHQAHMRGICPVSMENVIVSEAGNCGWCGCYHVNARDRLKQLKQFEEVRRLEFKSQQRVEIQAWQASMQMPMNFDAALTWE